MKKILLFSSIALAATLSANADVIALADMDLSYITCLSGEAVHKNQSTKGTDLAIRGTVYGGVGTHAPSKCIIRLNGATEFHTLLGITDSAESPSTKANHGIAEYTVTLHKNHETEVRASGTITRDDSAPVEVNLRDLAGYEYLELDFATGSQAWADHCAWADALFTYTGTAPETCSGLYTDPAPAIIQLPTAGPNGEQIVPLSSLDISLIQNGWRTPQANKSIEQNTITINGKRYASGVGIHAPAKAVVKLNGSATHFHCEIGIDDEANTPASADFSVKIRNTSGAERVVSTAVLRRMNDAVVVDCDFQAGDKYLIIEVGDYNGSNDSDHVDLANAYFHFVFQNSNPPELVSPDVLNSTLNCATVLFSQPGVRFMHRLHSNNPDATFSVTGLPEGLTFNTRRNLVEGIVTQEGEYTYTVHTANPGEEAVATPISLTVSSHLQQPTPFMGWISWNTIEGDISEDVVRKACDGMISSGLFDAGYTVICMDDLWHASSRAANGKPQANATRFPNGIKPVADYVHSRGMKLGLYSDAAGSTCAGAFGSLGYETVDANTYAEWGIDILKYDYCHAPTDRATTITRYTTMGNALKASGRDIIFYGCEWGQNNPWEWAPQAGCSTWRVTLDVRDCWEARSPGIGVVQSLAQVKDLWPYSGVNRFNDADMLCVGINGKGKSSSDLCLGTPGMTKTEYRTQFALWCMWSSPLGLSFDVRNPISETDLAIMTNPEMIALNQDKMGQAAEWLGADANQCNLLVKDLENGDVAIAVVNMSDAKQSYVIDFAAIAALDPTKTYKVRDVQKLENLDDAIGSISIPSIAKHETKVYRLSLDNTSGIDNVATQSLDQMTTEVTAKGIVVKLPGTEGVSKRVLVSDTLGRVLGSATTTEVEVVFPTSSQELLVVNAVCAGRAISKVIRR